MAFVWARRLMFTNVRSYTLCQQWTRWEQHRSIFGSNVLFLSGKRIGKPPGKLQGKPQRRPPGYKYGNNKWPSSKGRSASSKNTQTAKVVNRKQTSNTSPESKPVKPTKQPLDEESLKFLQSSTVGAKMNVSAKRDIQRRIAEKATAQPEKAKGKARNVDGTEIREQKIVDCMHIYVRGGGGGMGSRKYRGLGGDGGDVYLEVKHCTLANLKQKQPNKRFIAESGGHCSLIKRKGRRGDDLVLNVPQGVVVTLQNDRSAVLADLDTYGQKILVAEGGKGGTVFTSPPFRGTKGERKVIRLELKMIADVGLVGFPNAGKSTLLSKLSRAAPKVASYPFTTLRPHIGVVEYIGHDHVHLADLPGLIEGAHYNRGMGHSFLRHVERTHALLFVVDINGFQLSDEEEFRSPLETIDILADELELYKSGLSQRPAILCISKMDTDGADKKCQQLLSKLSKYIAKGVSLPTLTMESRHVRKSEDKLFSDEDLEFVRAQRAELGLEPGTPKEQFEEEEDREDFDQAEIEDEDDDCEDVDGDDMSNGLTNGSHELNETSENQEESKLRVVKESRKHASSRPSICFEEIIPISSISGEGLDRLYVGLRRVVEKAQLQNERKKIDLSDSMSRNES